MAPAATAALTRGSLSPLARPVKSRVAHASGSLPDSIAAASPDRLQQLIAMMVERVETANRRVVWVVWRPEVRPFLVAAARTEWEQVRR